MSSSPTGSRSGQATGCASTANRLWSASASRVEDRIATVDRASSLERLWTKFAGHFEMTELYEVSFIDRTKL